jgi:cytochrome c biogenesis protein CcmG/thiol:disulfide interchange protein DsbE
MEDWTRSAGVSEPSVVARRRLLALLPAASVFGLGGLMAAGLYRRSDVLPSALIGKSVPTFSLPPVRGRQLGLSSTDLHGSVSLVNVFASWCVACREEHPVLLGLAKSGRVAMHGIDYRDDPADAAAWLDSLGDPYQRTGADIDGKVAIDWGVYGVPETYVVGADARVRHRHVGALTKDDLEQTILPMVEDLRKASGRSPT